MQMPRLKKKSHKRKKELEKTHQTECILLRLEWD